MILAVEKTGELKGESVSRTAALSLFSMLQAQGLAAFQILAPSAVEAYEDRRVTQGRLSELYRLRGASAQEREKTKVG